MTPPDPTDLRVANHLADDVAELFPDVNDRRLIVRIVRALISSASDRPAEHGRADSQDS
jgi:hypothetical protein